ncbi:transcription factor bHLH110 isoform X1 [Actinidia eriantha]|uniref:transcription factor bHLH110 isoform X1 n=1 Tax=Actinidia eriantha TaxID=165200 RepID=UPI0025900B1E|nr:transcription factor bHLH110 isoform X1 [Actinidia eriantha]
MDSANLHHHHHHHHHQLQDQLLVGSSPLATPPSCYGLGNSTHAWTTPNSLLNPSSFSPNGNGVITNARDHSRQQHDFLVPNSLHSSMNLQDLGFHSPHDMHLARINGELSDSYQKFTEMLQPHTSYMKNEERDLSDMSEKLLIRNFSLGNSQLKGIQFPAGTPSRGNFSQIFPTINISDLNHSSPAISSSLDLFTSADHRFSGCLNQASLSDNLGFYYGLDHMQQSSHRHLSKMSPIGNSSFSSGVTEAKRAMEPKVPQSAQKKSRSESRVSCPPIKVRKEKLGDRIAALQQLVAPFGKTDTASVLMEAIGYIKFLQNQVEQTLSVPYMKASRNHRTNRTIRGGPTEDGTKEPKRDLRSRGLCLVPLSCLSYVTDGGGGVWPPVV